MNKLITLPETMTLNSRKRIISRMQEESPHSDTHANRDPHPFYEPEYRSLANTLVEYEIASAQERQKRDAMIACWRNFLHSLLKTPGPVDIQALHKLIDTMDNFLNRAGGRRK